MRRASVMNLPMGLVTAKFLLSMDDKPNFTVVDEKAVAKPPEMKF